MSDSLHKYMNQRKAGAPKKSILSDNLDLTVHPSMSKIETLWQNKDYEGILQERIPILGGVPTSKDRRFSAIAQELQQVCPLELQVRYPLSMLRIALVLLSEAQPQQALDVLVTIRNSAQAKEDEREQKALLGECMLVEAISYCPDVEKMLSTLKQAAALANGRVAVVDADDPFLYCISSPFCVIHTVTGKADEQGRQYSQFSELYEKLTGGGGRGAGELYQAGLHYYRGEFKQAELLCFKAAYLADSAHQYSLHMGAARLLAEICMHKTDMEAFSDAVALLKQAASTDSVYAPIVAQMLEFEYADLHLEISAIEHIPLWVQSNEMGFGPPVVRNYLKFMQIRYFFYSKKYERTIGLGEVLLLQQETFGVMIYALIGLYVACSYILLDLFDKGIDLFNRSYPPLFEDRLYLVFSYFYENMGDEFAEYLEQTYPEDSAAIVKLRKSNQDGLMRFMHVYLEDEGNLSERERAVAELAAEGLHNKEISERLGISANTVRSHMRKVFEKLAVDRRSELGRLLK